MSARTRGAALAIAGFIAPIWFITLVVIQGILQPDYSHITMPVSALAAWPAGWMQRLNFHGVAALMAIFAMGVHRTVQPTRYGLLGIVLLLASCLGLVIAGLFPWIMVNGVPTKPSPMWSVPSSRFLAPAQASSLSRGACARTLGGGAWRRMCSPRVW